MKLFLAVVMVVMMATTGIAADVTNTDINTIKDANSRSLQVERW